MTHRMSHSIIPGYLDRLHAVATMRPVGTILNECDAALSIGKTIADASNCYHTPDNIKFRHGNGRGDARAADYIAKDNALLLGQEVADLKIVADPLHQRQDVFSLPSRVLQVWQRRPLRRGLLFR